MGAGARCPLLNGVLVRKWSDEQTTQLVLPQRLRKSIFEMTHDGKLAAHLGAQRTYLQMKADYYWPCVKRDVAT